MKKSVIFLLGIVIILSACKRDPEITLATLPGIDTTLIDVSYGNDPLQKMDVYLPVKRTTETKLIIYLHGGSWYTGDKSEAASTAKYFQGRGYAFITMNYRLTRTAENNINPAQMHDIGMALDFISNKYKEWIITGNHICLFGASAGANLALLYAYRYNDNHKVKAVVSACAPIDLTDSNIAPLKDYIKSFVGSDISDNKEAWIEASPEDYLSASCVPTLFYQGTADNTVPYQQAVNAYNQLLALGVNTKLVLFQGGGHDLGVYNDTIQPGIADFINTAYP